MEKLIAIDGNSLMHRAFYALPPMVTKNGVPTGAVYGFVRMMLKLCEMKPDYLLVAFDMHGATFRHEQYDAYKAGRRATPDELRSQLKLIRELLKNMGIAVIECERYEADDILGTYARIANENDIDTLLVTGDRDALQLITDKTHVLMTKKGISDTIEFDKATLFESYGLPPERMPDLKGLMGDASDNLPGVPGIGEKTALKLLEKYGTMQNTLDNAMNEKGALQKKLLEGRESAQMSYRLGTINTHAPVNGVLDECAFDADTMRGAIPLINELEMRSIVEMLGDAGEKEQKTSAVQYKTIRINDLAALNCAAEKLQGAKRVAIHIGESIFVADDAQRQYEIVLGGTLLEPGLDEKTALDALKCLLESENTEKLVFDSKRLRHLLANYGIELINTPFDAMIADYLINAIHPADSLKNLAAERGMNTSADAAVLMELYAPMMSELREKELLSLYEEIEMPLSNVLFQMESEGFTLDTNALTYLGNTFKARIDDIAEHIFSLCGETFNILSPKQLGVILFEKLKLPPQKKNKSGYSTDAEVLEKLSEMHPAVSLILEYRFLSKLKSTFIDGLINLVSKDDGRVRTRFNQTVTATGRISSTEPNLQNIPVRTELGREIRRAFIASEGCVLVDADYSQIELRLLAHMSGDTRMIDAFVSGDDIHRRTASEVFGVPLDMVTKEQRSAAKAVNFGIVYGISDFGLSKNLNISKKQAQEYIDMYLARYTGVDEYMKKSIERGKRDGFAVTLMGRRRYLPELKSSVYTTRSFGERVAMNMPIQGTAADIIKLAMVRVYNALKENGLKSKLILQIHDELIIDTPADETEKVKMLLKDCMENVINLSVPLIADVEVGKSWYDTK